MTGYKSLQYDLTPNQIKNNRITTAKNKQTINAHIVYWENKVLKLQEQTAGQFITLKQILARLSQPKGGTTISSACERYCERRIAENTVKNYRIAVRDFIEICGDLPVINISHENLYEFVQESLKIRSHNTVANRLKKLKAIHRDCLNRGECDKNPFERVTLSEKPGSNLALTLDQLKEFRDVKGISQPQRLARDIWMFQFYAQGMRISDALRVTAENIQGDVLIYKAYKTGKVHRVPMIEEIKLPEHGWIPNEGTSEEIGRLTARINKNLSNLSKRLGFEFNVTTHLARHTFASLAEKEASLATVQNILKHTNISQTVAYMNSVRNEDHRDVSEAVIKRLDK